MLLLGNIYFLFNIQIINRLEEVPIHKRFSLIPYYISNPLFSERINNFYTGNMPTF